MKKKTGALFEKIFKYPLFIIIFTLAVTVILGIQMKDLVLDNDSTNFLPRNNPTRVEYRRVEEVYGGSMIMAITMKMKEGFVYSKDNLIILDKITQEVEAIENISKVTSIVNADYLAGTEDGIETMKLIDKLPENEADEKAVIERLNSWKLYKGNLFSKDYKSTMIAIKLSLGAKNKIAEAVYKEVKNIIKKYENCGFEFYVAGLPSVLVVMADNLRKDLIRLVPFVIIILIITLFLSFRTAGGVILPTVTVVITSICTLGLMSLFKLTLTMVGSAIPVLMIAVGSAYGIHILSHYYDEIDKERLKNKEISEARNKEIIFETIKRIGWAVWLAALTTIAGFGSLAVSEMVPLKEFGIFTAIGVLIAFLTAITFIPSILILRHKALEHKIIKTTDDNKVRLDPVTKVLLALYRFISKNKIRAVIIAVIILGITIFGTLKVIIGNPMVNNFRKSTEIRKADAFTNKNFNGTTLLEVTVKGKKPGSLTHPDILYQIDQLSSHLENKFSGTVNVMSFADLVKKMNQVMNVDEEGNYYEIPYNPAKYRCADKTELKKLIAQYLLLYSGNISDYVDDPIEPSETKITAILNSPDFEFINSVREEIMNWTAKNFPEGYEVVTSGNAVLQVVVSELIVDSQIWNILSSLLAIFLILAVYYRSFNAGVFGVTTLAIPIFLNFAVMGFFKIRLDAGTAMVASVAIGIGIDYTIHFLNAYHHERKATDNLDLVTTKALMTSGKAIVFNATAVAFGFLVFTFSNFLPLVNFGILIALTMLTSSLSAMTLLPVLLNIFKPKFISKISGK